MTLLIANGSPGQPGPIHALRLVDPVNVNDKGLKSTQVALMEGNLVRGLLQRQKNAL